MSRQEDFFNEATKQIKDSYVFQNEETYSDNDVRDIATSLAEYGYQYAIEKACKWLEFIDVQGYLKFVPGFGYVIEDGDAIRDFRKAMEE